jgi:hypothetical protein
MMMMPISALWATTLLSTALPAKSQAEITPTQTSAAPLTVLAQWDVPQTKEPQTTEPPRKGGFKPTHKPAAQAAPATQSLSAPPPVPEAPEPRTPAGAVGEFQPVLHAQGAKITTCMDTIVGESAAVIDSAHTAISSWATASPDENLFVSIIGLSYANKLAPNAAALIVAAPVGSNKCAGGTVQIYPFAQSCSAIQASLIKEGHTIATLRALPVVETKAGVRNVLMPTAGGGCVVIAVGLR